MAFCSTAFKWALFCNKQPNTMKIITQMAITTKKQTRENDNKINRQMRMTIETDKC